MVFPVETTVLGIGFYFTLNFYVLFWVYNIFGAYVYAFTERVAKGYFYYVSKGIMRLRLLLLNFASLICDISLWPYLVL